MTPLQAPRPCRLPVERHSEGRGFLRPQSPWMLARTDRRTPSSLDHPRLAPSGRRRSREISGPRVRFRPAKGPREASNLDASRRVHWGRGERHRDARGDVEGRRCRGGGSDRLLREPCPGSAAPGRRGAGAGGLLPGSRRAAGPLVGLGLRVRGSRRGGVAGAATGAVGGPPSRYGGRAGAPVRGPVGAGVRRHVLGGQVGVGAVGAQHRPVGAGRGGRGA